MIGYLHSYNGWGWCVRAGSTKVHSLKEMQYGSFAKSEYLNWSLTPALQSSNSCTLGISKSSPSPYRKTIILLAFYSSAHTGTIHYYKYYNACNISAYRILYNYTDTYPTCSIIQLTFFPSGRCCMVWRGRACTERLAWCSCSNSLKKKTSGETPIQ